MAIFVSINKGFGGAEKQFDQLYYDISRFFKSTNNWIYERHDLSSESFFKVLRNVLKIRHQKVIYNMSVLGVEVFFLLLLWALGNRIFLYPHVVVSPAKSRPRLWLIRILLQRVCAHISCKVIAISDGNYFVLERYVAQEKIVRVYNYVSCENSNQFSKNYFNNEIAIIGRMQNKHKRQLDFVRRHGVFVKESGLIIHFFGSGPDELSTRALVKSEGLDDNFIFHGWMSEDEIFSKPFSFVLNLSNWEGLPLSVLESIYRDRVVLASNIDGNRELVYGDFLFANDVDLENILTDMVVNKKINIDLLIAQKNRVFQRCNRNKALSALADLIGRELQRN